MKYNLARALSGVLRSVPETHRTVLFDERVAGFTLEPIDGLHGGDAFALLGWVWLHRPPPLSILQAILRYARHVATHLEK